MLTEPQMRCALTRVGQIVGTIRDLEYDAVNDIYGSVNQESFLIDGATTETSTMTNVLGMNNDGTYVGTAQVDGDLVRFPDTGGFGQVAAIQEQGEPLQDIGTLGGFVAFGFDINDDGLVSGRSRVDNATSAYNAYIYSEAAGMVDMGTFGFNSANLRALNNSNWALGWGSDDFLMADTPTFTPFLLNLNTDELFFLTTIWTRQVIFVSLDFAYTLNENNDIVGYGTTRDGRTEAFLMSFQGFQIPEPSAYLLMLMGLAGMGVARRRKH